MARSTRRGMKFHTRRTIKSYYEIIDRRPCVMRRWRFLSEREKRSGDHATLLVSSEKNELRTYGVDNVRLDEERC